MVVSDHRMGRMRRCLPAPLWFAALVLGDVLIFADTVIHAGRMFDADAEGYFSELVRPIYKQ